MESVVLDPAVVEVAIGIDIHAAGPGKTRNR